MRSYLAYCHPEGLLQKQKIHHRLLFAHKTEAPAVFTSSTLTMTPCQSLHHRHYTRTTDRIRVVDVIKLALEISTMDTPYSSTPLHAQFPQSSPKANTSLTPPLDQVTICSSDDDDDDDSATSFSSVSDNDFPETATAQTTGSAKRSIFKQYWAKTGGSDDLQVITTCGARPPPPTIVIAQSSLGGNHEIKPKQEPQQQQQQQRSIFHCFQKNYVSKSLPLLNIMAAQGVAVTTSAPLNKQCKEQVKTSRSCLLRECRYSGTKTPRDSSSSSSSSSCGDNSERSSISERSVSFSAEVKVLVYQKPLERYATKGWSNYFA